MADFAIQAKAQDINMVAKFESDLHNLLNILGKTGVEVVAPGTAFKIYKTSGSASTAAVAEKGLIPDSGIEVGEPTLVEVGYSKYRNLVGIEKVGSRGYKAAVGGANSVLLKDVQRGIRASIFEAIAKGTTKVATATDFQSAVAAAAGKVAVKFEDEAATPVFFAHPEDVYDYLGSHSVTVESAYGLSYLENFMGIGNVVIDSNVAKGSVYGTACENLAVVAASVSAIPGIDMQTDASGIVGVHNGARYENAALETVAYCGLAVQPIFLDRIVISSIKSA